MYVSSPNSTIDIYKLTNPDPGAGDRGGNNDDGANYVLLLSDLQDRMDADGKDYVVSFTTPSSYYYLQHFELGEMMEYADFTNLMAYDLHGTWDSPDDQIGSIVLAHTNLTEINAALDLFWRNSIDPSKINLGIGFYGRSFQLSDPACWQPGCPFKGGADEGSVSFTGSPVTQGTRTNGGITSARNKLVSYPTGRSWLSKTSLTSRHTGIRPML